LFISREADTYALCICMRISLTLVAYDQRRLAPVNSVLLLCHILFFTFAPCQSVVKPDQKPHESRGRPRRRSMQAFESEGCLASFQRLACYRVRSTYCIDHRSCVCVVSFGGGERECVCVCLNCTVYVRDCVRAQ
jgi:hypothetical protein